MSQSLNGGESPVALTQWHGALYGECTCPACYIELPLGRYAPSAQSSQLPAYTKAEVEAMLSSLDETTWR